MVKYNFWTKADTKWMGHIGEVMSGREENLPEIGKYNGAQKIVFWLMTLLILVLFGTGIMIWYEYFGASFTIEQQRLGARQQGAQQTHPRPLSAGERGRVARGESMQPGATERLLHRGFSRLAAHAFR